VAGSRIRSGIQYRAKGAKGCQAEGRIVDECREIFTFSKKLEIKKTLAVLPWYPKVWNTGMVVFEFCSSKFEWKSFREDGSRTTLTSAKALESLWKNPNVVEKMQGKLWISMEIVSVGVRSSFSLLSCSKSPQINISALLLDSKSESAARW
jgi:hypothetical protein